MTFPPDSTLAIVGGTIAPLPLTPDTTRLIVELEAPLAPAAAGADRTAALALARDTVLAAAQDADLPLTPLATFDTLLSGMVIAAAPADRERIAALPGVLRVSADWPVWAAAAGDGAAQIGAPSAWLLTDPAGRPLTGRGVRVAVIDSGVDYTHPDLGGCLGAGCRVVGGYDFVSGDADPRDEHGHGTHVAGILAANGALRGVAPEADILAYRVLDARGAGSAAAVIAALELAADPDGNPATDDGATVINLSLGGRGDADDALSRAVDQAVARGIVVVVAAGNSGPALQTVGSPGASRRAITVGAHDGNGAIAVFSSRGPAPGAPESLKPEVVAPGVSIRSTAARSGVQGSADGYRVMSGTSMAAPHVAGAAALLRQLNPTWAPEAIKARLMNRAIDTGAPSAAQGAGRIDLVAATAPGLTIEPGALSLLAPDAADRPWSASRSLTIVNRSATQRTIALAADLPAGMAGAITPASLVLAPGASREVSLLIDVAPDMLAAPATGSAGPTGAIRVSGDEASRVPVALAGGPALRLSFDREPWIVLIHDRAGHSWTYPTPAQTLSAPLPAGTYDILAVYADAQAYRFVVREGVAVAGPTELSLSAEQAEHSVGTVLRDIDGRVIPYGPGAGDSGQVALTHVPTGVRLLLTGARRPSERVSDMSDDYRYEVRTGATARQAAGVFYDYYFRAEGARRDLELQSDPAAMRRVDYTFRPEAGVGAVRLVLVRAHGGWSFPDRGRVLPAPVAARVYAAPLPADAFIRFSAIELYDAATQELLSRSPLLHTRDRDTTDIYLRDSRAPDGAVLVESSREPRVALGHSLPFWAGRLSDGAGELLLVPARGSWSWLFLGQGFDLRPHSGLPFTLLRAGLPVAEGTLGDGVGSPWSNHAPGIASDGGGPYTLIVPYGRYSVAGRPGLARATLDFDTRRADSIPPAIVAMRLQDGARSIEALPAGRTAELRIELADVGGLGRVSAAYRTGADWVALDVDAAGGVLRAQVPSLPAGTLVDLRVVAEDASGNRLTYELTPATIAALDAPEIFLPTIGR